MNLPRASQTQKRFDHVLTVYLQILFLKNTSWRCETVRDKRHVAWMFITKTKRIYLHLNSKDSTVLRLRISNK